jgi:hypothetical protein
MKITPHLILSPWGEEINRFFKPSHFCHSCRGRNPGFSKYFCIPLPAVGRQVFSHGGFRINYKNVKIIFKKIQLCKRCLRKGD